MAEPDAPRVACWQGSDEGPLRAPDRNQGGVGDLAYPLVSDLKREITTRYNVLTPDGVALRGLFIIDKEVRCPPSRAFQPSLSQG